MLTLNLKYYECILLMCKVYNIQTFSIHSLVIKRSNFKLFFSKKGKSMTKIN